MLWALAFVVAIVAASAPTRADPVTDCWKGSGEVSIRGCTALIQKNPRDVSAHFYRGKAYSYQGDHDRAIADFTRVIAIDPRDVAYLVRGDAYYDKKEYDRAIADYAKAIEIDPRDVAYILRGNAYYRRKDSDRAIADYSRAIEINSRSAVAYYNRGNIYKEKEEYDRAIGDLTSAIEIDPGHGHAYNDRGWAYYKTLEFDRAIADYTRQIEINPQHEHAYSNRGLSKFHRGDFKGAAIDLSRAVELRDDAYWVLFRYLAMARAGEPAANELEANAFRIKSKKWPYPAIELLANLRSPESTLRAAAKADKVGAAHFYIGEWHLLSGDKPAATAAFEVAVDTCPKHFVEHSAAVEELKRINP